MALPVGQPLKPTAFFQRMGTLFAEGRLEDVADLWHFPSPTMMGPDIHLMRTRADFLAYLERRREPAVARGLVAMEPLVAAVELPRYGRLRVWLRWRATFAHGVVDDPDGSVYYLSRSAQGRLAVEMMETAPRPEAALQRAFA